MKQALTCVGSSLLAVALVSLMGFGPLNPPAGPVVPTGASLDDVLRSVEGMKLGGLKLPVRSLQGGGTATLTGTGGTVTIPLLGYEVRTDVAVPVGGGGTHDNFYSASEIVTLFFEAGRRGGAVSEKVGTSFPGWGVSPIQLALQGTDGSTLGMSGNATFTFRGRRLVNMPTAYGNQAVEILELSVNQPTVTITDPSGTGPF